MKYGPFIIPIHCCLTRAGDLTKGGDIKKGGELVNGGRDSMLRLNACETS